MVFHEQWYRTLKGINRLIVILPIEGFKYVEAYPAKDGGNLGKAFTGPMRMYEKAGFEVVEQAEQSYVVRKKLSEN